MLVNPLWSSSSGYCSFIRDHFLEKIVCDWTEEITNYFSYFLFVQSKIICMQIADSISHFNEVHTLTAYTLKSVLVLACHQLLGLFSGFFT